MLTLFNIFNVEDQRLTQGNILIGMTTNNDNVTFRCCDTKCNTTWWRKRWNRSTPLTFLNAKEKQRRRLTLIDSINERFHRENLRLVVNVVDESYQNHNHQEEIEILENE